MKTARPGRSGFLVWCIVCATSVTAGSAAVTGPVYPGNAGRLGGTLGDGVLGPFDYLADDADWTFNGSSGYEGALTLSGPPGDRDLEHRIVWEYDLSGLGLTPPLTATVTFTLRGTPRFDTTRDLSVDLHVYAYPANLIEDPDLSDYHATPATLQGSVHIEARDERQFDVNITGAVVAALNAGETAVGLRFQVDPHTPKDSNQTFMDTVDADDTTKPFLTIDDALLGDANGDGVLTLADFASLPACMEGPGVLVAGNCPVFDFDFDGDVDLRDVAGFQFFQSLFSFN